MNAQNQADALEVIFSKSLNPNLPRPPSVLPMCLQADKATAQALAALSDASGGTLPADAFKELAARNDALLGNSREEIRATLARQIVLLEAASTRYLTLMARAKNQDYAGVYSKIAMNAHRCLVSAMGALHQIDEESKDAHVIDA